MRIPAYLLCAPRGAISCLVADLAFDTLQNADVYKMLNNFVLSYLKLVGVFVRATLRRIRSRAELRLKRSGGAVLSKDRCQLQLLPHTPGL